MKYEELICAHKDLHIHEMDLSEVPKLKGLYYNGNIAIEKKMSQIEKSCVLAEELGHHYTTSGNILDQSDVMNRKQELRARLWAYDRQIGLMGIISAWKHNCRTRYDMADFLGVTEEFLSEAISAYRNKYGVYKALDRYLIYFYPNLAIVEFVDI